MYDDLNAKIIFQVLLIVFVEYSDRKTQNTDTVLSSVVLLESWILVYI